MISEATAAPTTTFTPTYTQQQVYVLSCLAGQVNTATGQESELQSDMNATLQATKHMGPWQAVWGPCYTLAAGDLHRVNTMYVAQALDAARPTYVIAVDGTNFVSLYDWKIEDLDITPTPWPYAPNAGQVTTGDNDGLTDLLAMTFGGQTLQQFLFALPDKSNTSITFTGASLGGALSPMLTLALMDPASTLNAQNDVSLGNWAEISLQAMSGPSIGDAAFVSYFKTALAQASCEFIWNAHDVVPHSWNAQTMAELTSPANIYGLTLDSGSPLAKLLAAKQQEAAQYSYTQFQPTPAFAGELQPYTMTTSQGTWNPESQFLAQTLYQHTIAYTNAFGCAGWFTQTVQDYCGNPEGAAFLLGFVNAFSGQLSSSNP